MREPKFFRRYDYDRGRLPNRHLASLDNVNNIDEARELSGASIGYPGWNLLYYLVLSSIDPERDTTLLETGTNFGSSSIVLAQALIDSGAPSGRLHTFEIDEATYQRAATNIADAGLDASVVQHLGDAKSLLPSVVAELPSIRVAFLDGSHLSEDVVSEFRAIEHKLEPDSLVVFDNTYLIAEPHEDQRVHGGLKLILDEYGGHLINLPSVSWYTPGMALWQRKPLQGGVWGD